jgi:hypothetical protein
LADDDDMVICVRDGYVVHIRGNCCTQLTSDEVK